MTDEEFELFEDTAEKAATAKGIHHKKGYRGGGIKLPYESLKGAERVAYMGESTVSSNLQDLTWEQFKAMDRKGRVETLEKLVPTYGNVPFRLGRILGAPKNYFNCMVKSQRLQAVIDRCWRDMPKDQQDAANSRGMILADKRKEQHKSETFEPIVAAEVVQTIQAATPPPYWAETTIQRDGVAGKDLRAQIAGLLQAITDEGVYDVKIMVGARTE